MKSVVEMWYPGQEGGTATAKLLLGRTRSAASCRSRSRPALRTRPSRDIPSAARANGTINWCEGLFMGYRWYDQQNLQPLFPFGYGLSYTQFRYSGLDSNTKGGHGHDWL